MRIQRGNTRNGENRGQGGGRERKENGRDDKGKNGINLLQSLRGLDETKRHNEDLQYQRTEKNGIILSGIKGRIN